MITQELDVLPGPLLLRALGSCFQWKDNRLTSSCLDFISKMLPVSSLHDINKNDLGRFLIQACLNGDSALLLWLKSNNDDLAFVQTHANPALIVALLDIITQPHADDDDCRQLCTVLASLLPFQDLANPIVLKILPAILSYGSEHVPSHAELAHHDLMTELRTVWNTVDSEVKWKVLVEHNEVAEWTIRELEEVRTDRDHLHLSAFLVLILNQCSVSQEKDGKLLIDLVKSITEAIPATTHSEPEPVLDENVVSRLENYYKNLTAEFPYSTIQLSQLAREKLKDLAISSINDTLASDVLTIYTNFSSKHPTTSQDDAVIATLCNLESPSYELVSAITIFFLTLQSSFSPRQVDTILAASITYVWSILTLPSDHHVFNCVSLVWKLVDALSDKRVESALVTCFLDEEYSMEETFIAMNRVWEASFQAEKGKDINLLLGRVLFLICERLEKNNTENQLAKHWIDGVSESDEEMKKVVEIILGPMLEVEFLQRSGRDFKDDDDLHAYEYHARLALALLKTRLNETIFKEKAAGNTEYLGKNDMTYAEVLQKTVLKVLDFAVPADTEVFEAYNNALSVSLDILQILHGMELNDLHQTIQLLLCLLQQFPSSQLHTDSAALIQIRLLTFLFTLLDRLPSTTSETLDPALLQSITVGFTATTNLHVLNAWITVLTACIGLWKNSLSTTLRLVPCLCTCIHDVFTNYTRGESHNDALPLLFAYLKAAQQVLSSAHTTLAKEDKSLIPGADIQQNAEGSGFFGSVMSGVFAVESPQDRTEAINKRRTVLEAMRTVVEEVFTVWVWAEEYHTKVDKSLDPGATWKHTAKARLKFHARTLMIALYSMEPLETLEMFAAIGKTSPYIFKILRGMDGSKPGSTLPHLVNSLVSRVNPSSGSVTTSQSLQVTDLSTTELAAFLVAYLNSLEPDAVEEVFPDCMGFLREVYTYSAYKPLLPHVFKFAGILARKLDLTHFGDQRRVRRELSDVFMKVFNMCISSARNIVSMTAPSSEVPTSMSEHMAALDPSGASFVNDDDEPVAVTGKIVLEELAKALTEMLPALRAILAYDSDKVAVVFNGIITTLIVPAFKSKNFPTSLSPALTTLLLTLTSQPDTSKIWTQVIGDIILEQRFMSISLVQAQSWQALVSKWATADKLRLQDYIGRILTHGSTATVFSWADNATTVTAMLNLRRLAYIFLCGGPGAYLLNMQQIIGKLEEVLVTCPAATAAVYECMRAVVLRVDARYLSSWWTVIYTQLNKTFSQVLKGSSDVQEVASACKLLDTLLLLGLEDFKA